MNDNRLEDVIKEKLKNYSLPVDDNAWLEIERCLSVRSRKRIFRIWITGISVAASIILLWLIFPFNKQIMYYESTVQLPDHEKTITESLSEEKIVVLAELPSRSSQLVDNRQNAGQKEEIAVLSEPDVTDSSFIETEEKLSTTQEKMVEKKSIYENEANRRKWENQQPENNEPPFRKRKTKSLGIYMGSGNKFLAMNSHFDLSGAAGYGLRVGNIASNAPSFLEDGLLTPDDFSSTLHYPTISLGLSFRKKLNHYLSIESGVVYSYLCSKFENKFPQQDAKLELHYLGVPANLIVNLVADKYSKWNIYISGGGMVEKGLLSHYVQNRYINNLVVGTSSDNKIDGLQWSVNAAIGFDYKIVKNYSIYVAPDISYYLNNNQPYNVRTEHPLVFKLNAGIRYTW